MTKEVLKKYYIIPSIKKSIFREYLNNINTSDIAKIYFIGDRDDYRLIKRSFSHIKLIFIDSQIDKRKIKKIKDYHKCCFLVTSENYLNWICYFEKKVIELCNIIPMYDVHNSI